jgi:osmotically-inducible protein OsmY
MPMEEAMRHAMDKDSGQLPYPFGGASTDEQILTEVLNALHWHSGVPNDQVRVEVTRGHVVLSGIVAQQYQRELAESTAAEAPGVLQVTNMIKVES